MIALTTGLNELAQGVVYALPAFPCQILTEQIIQLSQSFSGTFVSIDTLTEPGNFFDGGFIKCPGTNSLAVVKKHTIGSSKSGAATSYAAAVLMDEPSYYWRLNEPSSTVAVERIQGLNGTISGGVTLNQPGALVDGDKCMVFDGVSGKIVTGNGTIPAIVSVEAWAKVTGTGQYDVISNRTEAAPGNRTSFGISGGNPYIWTSTNGLIPAYSVNNGQWHHIVWMLNSTTISIYVDGNFIQSASVVQIVSRTSTIGIGYDSEANAFFNGAIDEVAIYPYALSPAQISQHYKARSSPFIADSYASKVIASGPSNYWRLGETYGTVAKDVIGGANGTISGGVTLNQSGAIGDGNKAMTFDGTTANIATASANAYSPGTASFSLEAWLKTATSDTRRILSRRNLSGGDSSWFSLVLENGPSTGVMKLETVGGGLSGTTVPVNDGQWHHCVAVKVGSLVSYYVDGIARGTDPAGVSLLPTGGMEIGSLTGAAAQTFNGALDEVAIYPRALTAAEILNHYNKGRK